MAYLTKHGFSHHVGILVLSTHSMESLSVILLKGSRDRLGRDIWHVEEAIGEHHSVLESIRCTQPCRWKHLI